MPIDYFELVCNLKEKFTLDYGLEPTHLIVGLKDFFDMEKSPSLFERLKYIRDTISMGVVGNYLAGLKVIKTQSIVGIMVAFAPYSPPKNDNHKQQ